MTSKREFYTLPTPWQTSIDGWVAWLIASGASRETVRARKGVMRSIARRLPRTSGPAEVTTADLIGLCGGQRWSVDYRRHVRVALIGFYDWAVAGGVCETNPARGLPKVAESKPRPRPAPDSVWHQLIEQAGPRERLMARLAGEAGLRRAEVAQVHRRDLIEDIAGWSLIVHGKGGKQRIVPILASLAQAILDYHEPGGHDYLGFVFPGQIDGHISAGHVGVLISRLMPPGWSMHKLRHRYASRGFAGTHNLRAVQEALGHASVATTQRYTAVSGRDVRAVTEAAA